MSRVSITGPVVVTANGNTASIPFTLRLTVGMSAWIWMVSVPMLLPSFVSTMAFRLSATAQTYRGLPTEAFRGIVTAVLAALLAPAARAGNARLPSRVSLVLQVASFER